LPPPKSLQLQLNHRIPSSHPSRLPMSEPNEKQMKAAFKEGGKRGIEMEGASLAGLVWMNVAVHEAAGDAALLKEVIRGMNQEVDENAEDRKGGAGDIAKLVLSAGDDKLALRNHVPEKLVATLTAKEWMEFVVEKLGGKVTEASDSDAAGEVPLDEDKGRFPLKMRDEGIAVSIELLRGKGVFPEDSDDDDEEYIYGDDDLGV